MKLYEINAEYRDILNDIDNEDEQVRTNALAKLESNALAVKEKIIAVASFIKNMEAEHDAIKEAKTQMAEREKRFKKKIDDLESYLQANMEMRGISHISCPYFDIKLVKNPPSVNVEDEDKLDQEYIRTITEHKIDKAKLKEHLLAGVIIEGASLKQGTSLRIK